MSTTTACADRLHVGSPLVTCVTAAASWSRNSSPAHPAKSEPRSTAT
ncbi:hypothetical protein ACFV4M_26890 [Kitasatospora indigofera]